MRRPRTVGIVVVVAGLLAAIAALPAQAVQVDIAGHRERVVNHFGDPALGQTKLFAEIQFLDDDDDGVIDRLRAKSGNGELHGVLRNAIGRTALQQFDNSTRTFFDIAINDSGVNSNGAQPAIVRQWSPSVGVCPGHGTTFDRVYRARASRIATRWDDGWFTGDMRQYSSFVLAPMLVTDPACP